MRHARSLFASLAAAAVLTASPLMTAAAEPERLSPKLFDVAVSPGPVLDITFALALSDVSTYPVTITATAGAVEEQLWDGTLQEGLYRLRAPLTKIASGPVRVILRTKMTNLGAARKPTKPPEGKPPAKDATTKETTSGNQSFYVYRRWEGTIKR